MSNLLAGWRMKPIESLIEQSVYCTKDASDRCSGNIRADSDTISGLSGCQIYQMDVRSCLRAGTDGQCVLVVVHNPNLDLPSFL